MNDDGRSAWVGLVFHDRNAAFDFYLKFDEYFEKRNKKNEEFKIDTNVDFSLKTGINIILLIINLIFLIFQMENSIWD